MGEQLRVGALEAILEAVAFAAEQFLKTGWEQVIEEVLARLGQAAGVDRVYIYQNQCDRDDTLLANLRHEWVAPGIKPLIEIPELQCFDYQGVGFGRWKEMLERGKPIHGCVREFPQSERETLAAQDIQSVVVMPIFDGLDWWGFAGFGECRAEYEWSLTEVEALRAGASILGTAIGHRRLAEISESQFEFWKLISRVSAAFINMSFDEIDGGVNNAIAAIAQFASAAIGSVYVRSGDGAGIAITHQWCARRSDSQSGRAQGLSQETCGYCFGRLRRLKQVVIRRRADIPAEVHGEKECIAAFGFRPAVLVPMISEGDLYGALGFFGKIDEEREWPESLVLLLRFAADIIVSALERKEAEERARRESQELERLAAERAARIEELKRQQAESEKLAATGRMATRIAHEINNPLGAIKNSFLLIKDAISQDHPYYEYVGRIDREIDRIARIVREVFHLYKPEQEPARVFSANEAIEDVVELLKADSREHSVNITVDMPQDVLEVRLPRGAVVQVLYNILSNAAKASPTNGRVKVIARGTEQHVNIRVIDQGCGIPAEIGPRIFEPFFTTRSASPDQGLGLGLSISRSLVQAMGGRLEFQSRVGQGTVFRILLPRGLDQKGVWDGGKRTDSTG